MRTVEISQRDHCCQREWKDTWDSPTAYALLLASLVCPYLRVVSPLQAVAIDFLPEWSQFTDFPVWLLFT